MAKLLTVAIFVQIWICCKGIEIKLNETLPHWKFLMGANGGQNIFQFRFCYLDNGSEICPLRSTDASIVNKSICGCTILTDEGVNKTKLSILCNGDQNLTGIADSCPKHLSLTYSENMTATETSETSTENLLNDTVAAKKPTDDSDKKCKDEVSTTTLLLALFLAMSIIVNMVYFFVNHRILRDMDRTKFDIGPEPAVINNVAESEKPVAAPDLGAIYAEVNKPKRTRVKANNEKPLAAPADKEEINIKQQASEKTSSIRLKSRPESKLYEEIRFPR